MSSCAPSCRVVNSYPRVDIPNGKSVQGFATQVTPANIVYQTGGTISVHDSSLSSAQQRPFLMPTVWNSGCTSIYSTNSTVSGGCGVQAPATCKPTRHMFADMFQSTDKFVTATPAPCASHSGCKKQ